MATIWTRSSFIIWSTMLRTASSGSGAAPSGRGGSTLTSGFTDPGVSSCSAAEHIARALPRPHPRRLSAPWNAVPLRARTRPQAR